MDRSVILAVISGVCMSTSVFLLLSEASHFSTALAVGVTATNMLLGLFAAIEGKSGK